MTARLAETAGRAAVFALTLFGIVSHALLGAAVAVPESALPICAAAGLAIAWWEAARTPARAPVIDAPVDRRLRLVAIALLAITFGFLTLGACATPSRDWDGATSWDLRTRVLTQAPTLEQPFFRDLAQFAHSRDYPLLQPLVVASLARLGLGPQLARIYFPAAWLLLLVVIGATWRRLGVTRGQRTILVVACGLTPMLVDPTMGSFDSGFGDASSLCALTIAAAGLVTGDLACVFCGALLLPLFKPEGLLQGPVLIAVAWWCGNLRILLAALCGFSVGVVAWLPLYLGLNGGRSSHLLIATLCVALAGPIAVSAVQVRRLGRRTRGLLAIALACLALGTLWLCSSIETFGGQSGVLGEYLAGARALPSRLVQLPDIVLAIAVHAFTPRRFGLLAPLLVLLAFALRGSPRPARPLLTLLCCTLASLLFPFLTSPEADLGHHLRSSLDRLLLQQVGIAWLLAGSWWHAATTERKAAGPLSTAVNIQPTP